jgi:hypothetical protein
MITLNPQPSDGLVVAVGTPYLARVRARVWVGESWDPDMVLRTVGIQCEIDLLHLLARTRHYSYLALAPVPCSHNLLRSRLSQLPHHHCRYK